MISSDPAASLIACLTAVAVCGCDALTPGNVVSANDARLAYTGRFEAVAPDQVRFAWAGSRIDLRFSGPSLLMRIGDAPVDDDHRETDWFDVRVDGASPQALHLQEGVHVYPVATGLTPGTHRVAIVKRTEPEVATATLYGFLVEQGERVIAARRKPRQIELIGDSITTGYGTLGPQAPCEQEAAFENVEQAYGAVAARALDAGYTAVAWSGKGVLRNYDGTARGTLPELYERVLPAELGARAAVAARADAVVINLGTNDFFVGAPDRAQFIRAYRALLARVRARHPKALLVLVVGPMLADDFPQPNARSAMREWLGAVRDGLLAHGDSNVELFECWFDRSERPGCDQHPGPATHARLGRELAKRLRARLSW